MTTYIGLAIADSMFPDTCNIFRRPTSPDEVGMDLDGAISVCNPSHAATIAALKARYGIEIPIPPKPPVVSLQLGDALIVLSVRGLPRLTDRHEYTEAEISSATFAFGRWDVLE